MPTDSAVSHPVPLTDAQSGVWFAEQLGDRRSAYHLGLLVDLHGELDVPALERAVASVAARHPVLAAGVRSADGQPALWPGRHAIRLTSAGADIDPRHLLSRPFARTGEEPMARFVLQKLTPHHHRLVIAAHHLVFDGQSKDVLLRELAAAYAVPEERPPAPYADAVRAAVDRGHRQSAAARAYWDEQWVTPTPPLLPDLEAAPEPFSVAVPAGTAGVTTFELLLAATLLLLHRYGNDPATVAVDLSTRDREYADVIGMFVNELPVTVPAPAAGTFAEFAAAVRARVRALNPLRAVPMARVAPDRPGPQPAAVSMSYRRQGPAPSFAGLRTVVDWAPDVGAARGPLHLQIVDLGDRLLIRVLGAPGVGGHLRHLLDQVTRDPYRPIHELELEPPAALTGPAAEPATTLTHLLQEAVATGDVIAGAIRRPQAEVHAAALRLAHRLAARGIGPGQVVGLCAERGLPGLIGLLAIVRTGAAYLPLDPQYPEGRLRFMLADAAPALVLCTERNRALAGAVPALVLEPDDAGPDPDPADLVAPRPGDPAYVIYTSGSTGRPKGVVIPHRALVNLLRSMAAEVRCRPGDVWLWLTSLSFDISAVECFLPLLTGATVVIAADAQTRDGAALQGLVRDHRITHVQATPSTWDLILAADPPPWPGLTALSGGEPLTPALAERLLPRAGRLINVYGPTETTVWSTLAEVADPRRITVGRPLAGTTAYVVDRNLSRVPVGVTGQLALAGVGLADYYHARPGQTAERFVPDPFGPPGRRLYLTGDRARIRPDRTLHCLGRDDLQVKLRGHRIELGEIEARLREHPGITGAVVTVDHAAPEPRLVAYVTTAAEPDLSRLRARLGEQLPAVMVPALFVRLDTVPMTPNGKVDRNALPRPAPAPAQSPVDTPADAVTAAVTEIWCEALQRPHVGADEDLFDLGGHSLTITRIAARIRARLGVDLPLHVLWDAPTIAGTAGAVRAAMRS
ncbi:amino acid adenylation domain-containing protein [Dactylosporangium sp. NPDC049140]|uniref:non-ribosomal peptide synthetase n=1 Tax=Dactylosporangium sp. NPDC049140 TaxID=3155647 RepID=UPI003406731B